MSTFLQLYGEKLHIELGSEDTTSLFTTARRKQAINDAQLEYAKRTGCFRKVLSLTLVHNTREYDLESSGVLSATDFLRIWDDGVEFAFTSGGSATYRSGSDFPRRDVPWLNRNQAGWRSASATTIPQSWYLRRENGKTYFGMSEPPSITGGNTAAVTLPYVARPKDMTGDTDVPFTGSGSTDAQLVLEPWHQALAHYAAALLERLRKNVAAEQKQLTLFAGMVADYLQTDQITDGEMVFMATDYRAQAAECRARGRSGTR